MNDNFKKALNETLKEWKYVIKALREERLGRKLIVERDKRLKV